MSGIKDQVSVLLNKKMDRKDFLKYAAAAGMMAVGAGAVVSSIAKLNQTNSSKGQLGQASSNMGYGSSAYGGRPSAS